MSAFGRSLYLRGKGGMPIAGQQRGHKEPLNLWLRMPEPLSKLLKDRPSTDDQFSSFAMKQRLKETHLEH